MYHDATMHHSLCYHVSVSHYSVSSMKVKVMFYITYNTVSGI